jgi:hypothetical protein
MRIIAFFNLKDKTDPGQFLEWVRNKQAKVFEREIRGMKNFKVYITSDSDGETKLPKMVQIFDYKGTADDWRKVLKDFRKTDNEKISEIVKKWLEFCEDESTKIIYINDII